MVLHLQLRVWTPVTGLRSVRITEKIKQGDDMKIKLFQILSVCLTIGVSSLALAGGGQIGSSTLAKELDAVQKANMSCHISVILPDDASEAVKAKYNTLYKNFQQCTEFGGQRECLEIYEIPMAAKYDSKEEFLKASYSDSLVSIQIVLAPKNLIYNQVSYGFTLKQEGVEMSGFYPLWDRNWATQGAIQGRKYNGLNANVRYAGFLNSEKVGFFADCKVQFK